MKFKEIQHQVLHNVSACSWDLVGSQVSLQDPQPFLCHGQGVFSIHSEVILTCSLAPQFIPYATKVDQGGLRSSRPHTGPYLSNGVA